MAADLDLSIDLDALGAPATEGVPLALQATTIRPSRWANRHETSFMGTDFEELKAEIQDAGGNVQPIKVRPLHGPEDGILYEVVYGHRRHRACLELGLPVQAFVAELSDQQLWAEMERENRARANLSAWEQGMMYRRALDAGLFPSMRKLAEAIGRSVGAVSDAMAIAQLPPEVIEAFGSPGLIQFRYARELKDAVARDETAAREMARSLTGKGHPAAEVFQAIAAVGQPPHGVQRLNTLGVPPAQVLDAIPGTPSLHPVRPLRSSGPSKSRPNAASSVQRSNTLARQPPVLMAEHKGTPVEVDTQRQPANAGEVFVRGRGTSRWQRVPAGALKLLGFTRS